VFLLAATVLYQYYFQAVASKTLYIVGSGL